MTRYVWSGDQVLWELRLDAKDRFDLDAVSTTGPYHGRVSYFHAGGIDRPLVIRKEGEPTIIPHENWRGQFARGTYTSGAVSDCTGQTTGCTNINWPGYRTTARPARNGSGPDIRTWFGGLVDGMRDASGQMYMRNRYYDPATGQFTQTDPIGLAGGLNAYGFADGDPVSYSDPYGLCSVPTALGGVAFGYAVSRLAGASYGLREAADAALGRVGAIGVRALARANSVRRVRLAAAADDALDERCPRERRLPVGRRFSSRETGS